VVLALRPNALLVTTARVAREELTATTTAEGRSRIRDLYVVTAPVDGEIERIILEEGDSVSSGTVLARIGPAVPRPLDSRSRATAEAAVNSARAAVAEAEARRAEAEGAAAHADNQLATARILFAEKAVARNDVEHAEHEAEIRRRSVEAAGAAVNVARSEVRRAETQLRVGATGGSPALSVVRAPVAGRILRVARQSGGPVAAGEPLVELGNIATLEFFADLLTTDAMSVEAGANATIRHDAASSPLAARVRRVEPAAFTKISALGLEEQRVRVILDLAQEAPATLGHDFRVTVSIAIWKGTDVLTVPSTALFRVGESWAVFVVDGGRARLRPVTTGPSGAQKTVIEAGVREGEEVIVQPSDVIGDGSRVAGTPAS
jgi:HlyD family secretion protein